MSTLENKISQDHQKLKTHTKKDTELYLENKYEKIKAVYKTVEEMVRYLKEKQDEMLSFDLADLPQQKFELMQMKF